MATSLMRSEVPVRTSGGTTNTEHALQLLRDKVATYQRPNIMRLQRVLSLVLDGHGPAGISKQLSIPVAEVFSCVQELGTRYRTRGTHIEEGDDGGVLFPLSPSPESVAALPPRKRKKAEHIIDSLRQAAPLPLEWSRKDVPIQVQQAVKLIRTNLTREHSPAREVLLHELQAYPPQLKLITMASLAATWKLAQLDVLERLASNPATTHQAALTVLRSYEVLETVRKDAGQALVALLSGEHGREGLAVRARPLAEGPVQRLEEALAGVHGFSDPEAATERALARFRAQLTTEHMPASVGDLTGAQVIRIGQDLGLANDNQTGTLTSKSLNYLVEEGLERDLPTLRVLAGAAALAGREAQFREGIARLMSGEHDWITSLNEM